MHPTEVVIHDVDGHGRNVVFDLLAEGVGQPREPAHRHPHGERLSMLQRLGMPHLSHAAPFLSAARISKLTH
jgi:hypothetical protein